MIDQYINKFPEEIRKKLFLLKNIIKDVIPEAEETISYQMPTFKLKENIVHFACYKNHIGFYPTPDVILKFSKELSIYKTSKGAIQLPINEEIPIALIRKLVEYRLECIMKKYNLKI